MKQDFGEFELGGSGRWNAVPPPRADPPRRPFHPAVPAGLAAVLILAGIRSFWAGDDVDLSPPTVRPAAVADARGVAAPRARTHDCADDPAGTGGPARPPRPIGDMAMWVTPEDYPIASLRAEEQGVTSVLLGIDDGGRIAHCRIGASSGSRRLDAASCAAMQARGRFEPARDGRGCPIPFQRSVRIRWQIPAL